MEILEGQRIDGYTLHRRLGRGGQGSVWEVSDPLDGTLKALKVIELSQLSESAVARARQEADAVKRTGKHPAIVPCHKLFELPGELLGLVFDLVPARALADVMDDPRMTPSHRVVVLQRIAAALAHVHSSGVVHRDLKPANVLVTDAFWTSPEDAATIKLVDFGISRQSRDPRRVTAVHAVVGTTPYLPPELLIGPSTDETELPFARDAFAFGVLAWELLRGGHPTGLAAIAPRDAYQYAYREIRAGHRMWPASLFDGYAADAIRACLALDPRRRPESGAAIVRWLRPGDAGGAPSRPEAPTTTPHARPTETGGDARTETPTPATHGASSKPSRWLLAAFALGIGLVLTATAFVVLRGSSEPQLLPIPLEPTPGGISAPVATGSKQAIVSPVPCCEAKGTCKSGRACGSRDCKERLPARTWRLRVTGVAGRAQTAFSEDWSLSHPQASVCIRSRSLGDAELCVPLAAAAASKEGDRLRRPRVSTADIEQAGVEIRIEEGGRVLAEGRSAANVDGVAVSALCSGVILYAGGREAARARVFAYLDDGE